MTDQTSPVSEALDRAERALVRAGWTYTEGAAEWKPPLGPSASPLLDEIDRLRGLAQSPRERIAEIEAELAIARACNSNVDCLCRGEVMRLNLPGKIEP